MKFIVFLISLFGGILNSHAQDAASTVAAPNLTVWQMIVSGGWIMVPLAFFSIITVMLIFTFLFTLRRGNIVSGHFMHTADLMIKKKDYAGLLAISHRHGEAIARIVQRSLDFLVKNPNASLEVIQDIAETEGSSQAASLQNRVTYLADIAVLSPMIGLAGTVYGIIKSFGELASNQTSQATRPTLLAGGVAEALFATGAGLLLGILAMAFYALFRNRVQSLISDMEIASSHLMALLRMNYQKKREGSRVNLDDDF